MCDDRAVWRATEGTTTINSGADTLHENNGEKHYKNSEETQNCSILKKQQQQHIVGGVTNDAIYI